MARDFEDHCWKDVVSPEELEIYKHYERDVYVGERPALLMIDLYNFVYRGDPTAMERVGLGVLTRALFVGAGLALAGMKDPKDLVKYSLAGSLGVEAFVFGWVWANRGRPPERIKIA